VRAVVAATVVAGLVLAIGSAAAADAPTRDIAIPGKSYEPAHVTVLSGTTVTWRNGDSTNHTVTADGGAFDSGYVASGAGFSYTFARQGHYAYHCVIHKFMKGTVDVYSLVLTGPDAPVSVGASVVVAGLAPAGTDRVTFARLGAGEPLRTVTARPDGSFTVRFRATEPGSFRASAGKAVSPVVRIQVVPRVTATRAGSSLVVATKPARPGARVVLQSYDRDHFAWRVVAKARLGAGSRARLVIPAARPAHVRVVVRGERGWADGVSSVIALRR
jgi:plastocyanin